MLILQRGARGDVLAAGLAQVLSVPAGDDPLTPEIVAVPTRGIERWLAQQLAGRLGTAAGRTDGVCANVRFPFPGRLIGEALSAATGTDPRRDPWAPERCVWPLLDIVDAYGHEPWLKTLRAHLAGGSGVTTPTLDGGPPSSAVVGAGPDSSTAGGSLDAAEALAARRFPVVRRVADLFDRYGVHRPAMLRSWAAGRDSDGRGAPLPEDVRWQAELWRRLRDRLGIPSPAERLDNACVLLREHPELLAWPERLSLFGLTRLPASYLAILDAVAERRDVHLWLLHPSPALWARERDRLQSLASVGGVDGLVGPRHIPDDTSTATGNGSRRSAGSRSDVLTVHNPLLDTWGRDAREMQVVLTAGTNAGLADSADRHTAVDGDPATLLGRIQADVRADRDPPGPPAAGQPDTRYPLTADDRSLQIHSCHGRDRQIEVVRDAILHLLADNQTLEPRDVIVMCPDIDAFAPLVHAAFGSDEDGLAIDGRPALRVRLADRSLRQTNPMLDAVAQLMDLAGSRLTASQVLDFAGLPPVRRQFGFTDDELSRLTDWVAASGIRWGLDAEHRRSWRLDDIDAGTWRVGMRRVLTGVAASGDDFTLTCGVLPLDDVEGSDIELAGRAAELIDRLAEAVDDMAPRQTAAAWVTALRTATDALCRVSADDEWQRRQLHALLDDVADEAGARAGGRPSTTIALDEVRSLLADRLRGRPTRANFRTGQLTICTMVPMRSVPHRVVCLVGLDDGSFPRRTAPDGDDLLAREPWVGDQDPRSEDRQLLLDALMAATEHLVIVFSGKDERTNARRPPAVPIGELLDVIDRTATTGEQDERGVPVAARRQVMIEHPLQAFDARNFRPGGLLAGRPWGFDTVALGAARAAIGHRTEPGPFLAHPLGPLDEETIELDDLIGFVCHPVRAFLRRRLGVSLTGRDDEPDDALTVEPDALERWTVGDRLLAAGLRGVDMQLALAAERQRGTLGPGELAERVLADLVPNVERLLDAAAGLQAVGSPTSLDVSTPAGAGIPPVAGTVTDVVGDVVRTVTYSKLAAKHRLAAWVRLAALTAARPERAWRTVTIGRSAGLRPEVRIGGPLGGDTAERERCGHAALITLVDLYRRGLREPLPLYVRTSAAYADGRHRGRGGISEARQEWESAGPFPREDGDREHLLVLGGRRSFAEVCATSPAPDEQGAGWPSSEHHRFGLLACRLWDQLLATEVISR